MKSLLIYPTMQEESAGLCHAVESSRHQQVFLACCWVTVVSCLSCWPQTPVFLQVWLRPQKFPLERLSTQEWLTPNWPEHSFHLHGGNNSFKFFKHCKCEIHDAGFCSSEVTKADSSHWRFVVSISSCCSCSWLNVDHVAGTVLSTFISYPIRYTVVLWGSHCYQPILPMRNLKWIQCWPVMSNSLRPHGLWPARLLCPWILQAGILEWVAVPFSRGSSQPRDRIQVSHVAGGFWEALEPEGLSNLPKVTW